MKVGDRVQTKSGTSQKVTFVDKTGFFGMKNMVKLGDFYISRGHPVFVKNDWYRPDELWESVYRWQEELYNFRVDGDGTMVVGGDEEFVCAALGKHCPRIARLWPEKDRKYGAGHATNRPSQISLTCAFGN